METSENAFFQNEAFQKEVLRYMGCLDAQIDERIVSQIALISEELSFDINAKNVFGIWNCRIEADTVTLGEMNIKSQALACHLRNCRLIVLLAATLGTGADTLLRRYSALDMEKALIAQAVCTVMIERYCDTVVCEISQNPRVDGLYPTMRFSPGYCDFDIKWQKDVLKLLNTEKSIALSLSDGYMLIPSKSVTAVIGFSEEKTDTNKKCAYCTNIQCGYRKI
jgi:cobalamin-dependent methionine synthase I